MGSLYKIFDAFPVVPTEYLYHFFFGTAVSWFINGIILFFFIAGALIIFLGGLRTWREKRCLKEVRRIFLQGDKERPKELLDTIGTAALPPNTLTFQAIKNVQGVKRLEGNVEIMADALRLANAPRSSWSRYIAGILIILGLIGTILGLSQAVINLRGILLGMGEVVSRDSFRGIVSEMLGSLGFMETAFSSTLCGFLTFLVLSFLDQIYERAREDFAEDFESFYLNVLIPFFTPKQVENSLDTIANIMKLSGSGIVEISGGIADLVTLVTDNQEVYGRMAQTLHQTVDDIGLSQHKLKSHYKKIAEANDTFVKLTQGLARQLENNQDSVKELFNRLGGQKSEIETLYTRIEASIYSLDKNFKEGMLEASQNIIHAVDFQNQQIQRIESDHNSAFMNTNKKMIETFEQAGRLLADQKESNLKDLQKASETHKLAVQSIVDMHKDFVKSVDEGFQKNREEIAANQKSFESQIAGSIDGIAGRMEKVFESFLPVVANLIERQKEISIEMNEKLVAQFNNALETIADKEDKFYQKGILPLQDSLDRLIQSFESKQRHIVKILKRRLKYKDPEESGPQTEPRKGLIRSVLKRLSFNRKY